MLTEVSCYDVMILIFGLLAVMFISFAQLGVACAVCTVTVSLAEQLTIVHNQTVEAALGDLCNYLPDGLFRLTCKEAITIYGDTIINGFCSVIYST